VFRLGLCSEAYSAALDYHCWNYLLLR